MKALLRGSLATLVGSMALFAASTALADGEACFVDTDCPGTACGDAVCNWTKMSATPSGDKLYYCNPAGTQPAGADGWCTTDTDCKCMGEGAKCSAPYCTFTKAPGGSSAERAPGSAGAAIERRCATSSAGATSSALVPRRRALVLRRRRQLALRRPRRPRAATAAVAAALAHRATPPAAWQWRWVWSGSVWRSRVVVAERRTALRRLGASRVVPASTMHGSEHWSGFRSPLGLWVGRRGS